MYLPCETWLRHSYYHMQYSLTLASFIFSQLFPLIIINIIILYLANIYQVPIMSKAFFWVPLVFTQFLPPKGGRKTNLHMLWYKMVKGRSHMNKFINGTYFSGYDDHKTIHEWTVHRCYFYEIILWLFKKSICIRGWNYNLIANLQHIYLLIWDLLLQLRKKWYKNA